MKNMKKLMFIMILCVSILSCTNKNKEVYKPIPIVYNIPSLVNSCSIDSIVSVLGTPLDNSEPTKLQLKNGVKEWTKTFIKNDYELLITYNPKNRKVIDFFIATNDSSGSTNNCDNLLQITNLFDKFYRDFSQVDIKYIRAIGYSDRYTGIKIIPLMEKNREKEKIQQEKNEKIEKERLKNIENKEKEYYQTKAGKINKKHPEWSRDECELISNRRIWIGMSIDMVIYELGRNFGRNVSNYGDGNEYQYYWDNYSSPNMFYCKSDGIVYAYN